MIKTIKRLAKHHNIKIKDAALILIKVRFDYNLAKQIVKTINIKLLYKKTWRYKNEKQYKISMC